jgi:hypothetical protein
VWVALRRTWRTAELPSRLVVRAPPPPPQGEAATKAQDVRTLQGPHKAVCPYKKQRGPGEPQAMPWRRMRSSGL